MHMKTSDKSNKIQVIIDEWLVKNSCIRWENRLKLSKRSFSTNSAPKMNFSGSSFGDSFFLAIKNAARRSIPEIITSKRPPCKALRLPKIILSIWINKNIPITSAVNKKERINVILLRFISMQVFKDVIKHKSDKNFNCLLSNY